MKSRKKRILRAVLDVAIGVLILAVLAVLLNSVQTRLSVSRQEDNSLTKLSIAEKRLTQNAEEAADNLTTYDAFGQAKLDTVAWFLARNPDYTAVSGFAVQWGLDAFYTLDANRVAKEAGAPDFASDAVFAELFSNGKNVTVDNHRYYITARAEGGWYVGSRDFTAEDEKLDALTSPENALKTIKVGVNGYVFAVNTKTGIMEYHPEAALMGKNAAQVGWDPAQYPAGYDGWLTISGVKEYCISQSMGDYLLVAMIPASEINEYNRQNVGLMLLVFAVALILLISYALILRKDAAEQPKNPDSFLKVNEKLYLDLNIAGKLKNVALVGLIAVFGISLYMQTLSSLSRQALISATKLEAVESILDDNDERIAALTKEYSDEYARRAQNIAYTLAQDSTIVGDDDALTELAGCAQINAIYVFDTMGRVTSTNSVYKDFALSTEANDQSYAFWDVVKGYKELLVQDAQTDEYGAYMQYVGVKRLDADGMVELGILPRRLAGRLKTTELNYVLRSIAVENGGMLFAVDAETGKFISYPTQKYVGRTASEYGLSAAAQRDDYTGYQTIDGSECLVRCVERNGVLLYVAVPTQSIYSSRMTVAGLVTLGGLIAMLVISLFLIFGGKPEEGVKEVQPPTHENRYFKLLTPGGKTRTVQSAASRWTGSHQKWHEMNPEQKLTKIAKTMLGIAALALACYLWLGNGHFAKGSVLTYIMDHEWEKIPGLFSFSYIAIIVLEVVVISSIARRLISAVTQRFGARSETVGRLLDSFIKYGSVIGAIFYSLNFLGLDSTTLMTSAGILTLVVGLGAQSLISDILAGVFIVFEGEFRVGDIVTIGDWRGTVLEIGIRTTKIESAGKDIKIFNNSAISGVINMTKQHSYAYIDIGIEYGESLEHVESILNREMPHIKEHLPAIVSGPFYKGVASLGDSSVNIRIIAQCKENDRVQLTRDLNRELKLIFDHNGINIPFPQVVLNQPVEHEQATRAEKRQAAEFVEEQKELAKDIHVRDDG